MENNLNNLNNLKIREIKLKLRNEIKYFVSEFQKGRGIQHQIDTLKGKDLDSFFKSYLKKGVVLLKINQSDIGLVKDLLNVLANILLLAKTVEKMNVEDLESLLQEVYEKLSFRKPLD
jgi:hypothetical protein